MIDGKMISALLCGGTLLAGTHVGLTSTECMAQGAGPFAAHPGLKITRAYTSKHGPDAEEYNIITARQTGIDLSNFRFVDFATCALQHHERRPRPNLALSRRSLFDRF